MTRLVVIQLAIVIGCAGAIAGIVTWTLLQIKPRRSR